jgi:hypothetical protein
VHLSASRMALLRRRAIRGLLAHKALLDLQALLARREYPAPQERQDLRALLGLKGRLALKALPVQGAHKARRLSRCTMSNLRTHVSRVRQVAPLVLTHWRTLRSTEFQGTSEPSACFP